MADVFRVHDGTTNGSPIASTSHSTLDTDEGSGAGPSLAELLRETVRESARRGSRTSSSKSRNGASKIDSHAPLPSLPSLSSPSSRAYISSLLAKDLPALLKEPDELSRQSEVLDGDLATLCYKSIGDLLGVGECVDSVEDGFGRMQDSLDSLLSCTELLSSSCTDFTASITPIISSRARLNLVRNNIASIEDILSIPRLVSTCIRGGWWNEAVDLAFRARELEDILKSPSTTRKEPGKSRRSLLGKVREDVEDELEALRSRIIEGLRGRALKLPSAVRSIALLRRLSTAGTVANEQAPYNTSTRSLSEPELRLTFLTGRWDCLRSQLEQLEMSAGSAGNNDDRLRAIKRWVEVWREVIGETVTIYSEIFLVSSPSPSPGTSPLPPGATDSTPTMKSADSYSPLALTNAASPLSLFLAQARNALQTMLQQQLPHLTAVSSLVSLQTQLSYCSAAFSKFGFDFAHIPNRSIASRLLQLICERFDGAVEMLRKDLSRAFTLSGARGGKPRLIVSALVAAESWDSIEALEEADLSLLDTSKTSHPPAYIALFPPLARLVNNYAAAINELRLLPISNIYPTILRALRTSLNEAAGYMVQLVQTAIESQQTYGDDEHESEANEQSVVLRVTSIIFCRSIIPWISWTLDDIVYPDIAKTRWKDDDDVLREMTSKLLGLLSISDPHIPDATNTEIPRVDVEPVSRTEAASSTAVTASPVLLSQTKGIETTPQSLGEQSAQENNIEKSPQGSVAPDAGDNLSDALPEPISVEE